MDSVIFLCEIISDRYFSKFGKNNLKLILSHLKIREYFESSSGLGSSAKFLKRFHSRSMAVRLVLTDGIKHTMFDRILIQCPLRIVTSLNTEIDAVGKNGLKLMLLIGKRGQIK